MKLQRYECEKKKKQQKILLPRTMCLYARKNVLLVMVVRQLVWSGVIGQVIIMDWVKASWPLMSHFFGW